jgi:hypothetical protein
VEFGASAGGLVAVDRMPLIAPETAHRDHE